MPTQLATLAQVKQYIGNASDATDDSLLTALIESASARIERDCSRTFDLTQYSEIHDGDGSRRLTVRNSPLVSVSSLIINGRTIPQSTAFNADGWVVASPWGLSLRGQYRFEFGVQNVVITYSAGYPSIPDDLSQACAAMVSLLYKERDRLGLTSKSVGGESISYTTDMPEYVRRVIDSYRSVML